MVNPLDSKDLSSIQGVDNEINEFINQIEKGNAPNPTKLLQIEKELKSLINNKNIPDSVKQNLQRAFQQISGEGSTNLAGIYSVKKEVDQALEQGKLENEQL